LINNAGILPTDLPLEQLTADSMREGFEVNCLAPLFLTKALLPLLKKSANVNASGKEGRHLGRALAVQVIVPA
jgi:NAD(P)-dependent dehydrogenase (short-subunit alcohol dehydrogenase family)